MTTKGYNLEAPVKITAGVYSGREGRIVGKLGFVEHVGFCYKVKLKNPTQTVNIAFQFLAPKDDSKKS